MLILWLKQKKVRLETLHKLREARTMFRLPVVENVNKVNSREW